MSHVLQSRHVRAFVCVYATDCVKPSERVSTFTANIMQNLTSFFYSVVKCVPLWTDISLITTPVYRITPHPRPSSANCPAGLGSRTRGMVVISATYQDITTIAMLSHPCTTSFCHVWHFLKRLGRLIIVYIYI